MPREHLLLDVEDEGAIFDLLTKFESIWTVQKKYLYNKINLVNRKLLTCKPEEVDKLQDKIQTYLEIIADHEKIKGRHSQALKAKVPVKQKVKDIYHYIMNRDVRDDSGRVRLPTFK